MSSPLTKSNKRGRPPTKRALHDSSASPEKSRSREARAGPLDTPRRGRPPKNHKATPEKTGTPGKRGRPPTSSRRVIAESDSEDNEQSGDDKTLSDDGGGDDDDEGGTTEESKEISKSVAK